MENNLNQDYRKQLEKIIKPQKYHECTDLLINIILRRQREFDIPYERMIAEANNLVQYLDKIRIVSKKKMGNPQWEAQFNPTTKSIDFSYDFVLGILKGNSYDLDVLFEVLTHEVFHLIACGEFYETGFKNNMFDSRGLNELFNECAANRCAINYSQLDFNRKIRSTQGYGNLTIFSPLIASAFGVTEKEMLSAGISKGSAYSVRDLITKNMYDSNQTLDDGTRIYAEEFVKTLSKQIEVLHNIDIPMNKKQVVPENQKPIARSNTLTAMFNNLINISSFRLQNDIRPLTSDVVAEYAYSFKAMVGYINTTLDEYKNRNLISEQQVEEIKNSTLMQLEDLYNRIIGLREITKAMGSKDVTEIQEMLVYAKNGTLIGDNKCASYYGIVLQKNKLDELYDIDTSQQEYKVKNTDFELNHWFNYHDEEKLKNILKKKVGIRAYFYRPKEFIRNLFNKQKRLPPAQQLNGARIESYNKMINNPPKFIENMKNIEETGNRYCFEKEGSTTSQTIKDATYKKRRNRKNRIRRKRIKH